MTPPVELYSQNAPPDPVGFDTSEPEKKTYADAAMASVDDAAIVPMTTKTVSAALWHVPHAAARRRLLPRRASPSRKSDAKTSANGVASRACAPGTAAATAAPRRALAHPRTVREAIHDRTRADWSAPLSMPHLRVWSSSLSVRNADAAERVGPSDMTHTGRAPRHASLSDRGASYLLSQSRQERWDGSTAPHSVSSGKPPPGPRASRPASHASTTEAADERRRQQRWTGRRRRSRRFLVVRTRNWRSHVGGGMISHRFGPI